MKKPNYLIPKLLLVAIWIGITVFGFKMQDGTMIVIGMASVIICVIALLIEIYE